MDPVSAVANAIGGVFELGSSIANSVALGKQSKANIAIAQQQAYATQLGAQGQVDAARMGILAEQERQKTAAYEAAGQRALAQAQIAAAQGTGASWVAPFLILGVAAIGVAVVFNRKGKR